LKIFGPCNNNPLYGSLQNHLTKSHYRLYNYVVSTINLTYNVIKLIHPSSVIKLRTTVTTTTTATTTTTTATATATTTPTTTTYTIAHYMVASKIT